MITIEVRGLPAAQGSKRHVGGGRMVESSKAVGPWREAVRAETQRVMLDHVPLDGAVSLTAVFMLPRPRSHYRTGRNAHLLREAAPEHPSGRPDLDKLLRALLDGLTEGGAWRDDGQVSFLGAWKNWGTPGVRVELEQLGG